MGIPVGLRDILPQEAKELGKVNSNIRKIFEKFGYLEVNTPVFEYFDVLSSESSELIKREMFKMFDKDGRILALRPEMTTPIARLVAQRMADLPLPVRLYYIQNVFRDEPTQRGQQREFSQAGVELIGSNEPQADAEIITLMIESLLAAGLDDFQINVGQIDYIKACLDDEAVDEETKPKVIQAIMDGNIVDLMNTTKDINDKQARDNIRAIPTLHGEFINGIKIKDSDQRRKAALENLKTVVGLVQKQGLKEYIVADLGIVRNFNYYTGIIFEGYSNKLGFPISGGGRYDSLLGEFGFNQPATGFQIGLERLQIVLEKGRLTKDFEEDKFLVGYENNAEKMFEVAKTLRQSGKVCLNSLSAMELDAGLLSAREQGCTNYIQADYSSSEFRITNIKNNESEVCRLKDDADV